MNQRRNPTPDLHHLTRIRLHLAIYFLLHRENIREKAAPEQAAKRGIHGSRNSAACESAAFM
jgi:hypothetical protein